MAILLSSELSLCLQLYCLARQQYWMLLLCEVQLLPSAISTCLYSKGMHIVITTHTVNDQDAEHKMKVTHT